MSHKLPHKKVIAVLPAYHAVRTLRKTYDDIPKDWVDQIILVDDASSDETAALARALGITTVVHEHNKGYGANQKSCYREALRAGADIVVMVHPDFQYDPRFIPALISPIADGHHGAMFGSRMLNRLQAKQGGMPWWKYYANIGLTWFGNLVLGYHLSEYHSGFRAYAREALERTPFELNADGFSFDTEIIAQMKQFSFSIGEIPITTRYFPEASMIGFKKSVRYGCAFIVAMAAYCAHRWGVRYDRRLFPVVSVPCPGCHNRRTQIIAKRSPLPIDPTGTTYAITNPGPRVPLLYQCIHCDLVFTDPVAAELKEYYGNQPLDQEYVCEARGRLRCAERSLAYIERFQAVDLPKNLLDIGAGPGFFMKAAKEKGWQVEGIEIGTASVAFGKKHLDLQTLHHDDGTLLTTYRNESVSLITLWDVLEHVEEPKKLLERCFVLLRPGGGLALSTPRYGSSCSRIFGMRWHAIMPAHRTYFSREVVCRYLEESGFRVIAERSYLRFFSFRYLWNRVRGRSGGDDMRSLIIPVNLFDEMELYCVKP